VRFALNELDAIKTIEIEDHGTGIAVDDLDRAIAIIGRSLKL
jgi:HSP90 family molecular chaperone